VTGRESGQDAFEQVTVDVGQAEVQVLESGPTLGHRGIVIGVGID